MSIKTDAIVIRDETATGANTATRVGRNLVDIADDLTAKQAAIDLNTAKVGITAQQASDITTNNAKVGVTVEEANPDVVGQAEAEAGTATTERIWTAERVKQAIVALGGSGSVDDTAYGISWDGVTGTAPSKNALYDFIESQVFKVDASSNIIPIFWGGTQAEYDIDFPSGHTNEYFIVITDGAVSPTNASDIVNAPSGNLVATDVQGALNELQTEVDLNTAKVSFDSTSSTRLANTSGTNTGDNAVNTLYSGLTTNATHTGEVTGSGALILDATAVSNKTLDVALTGTEEVLINDGGLKKTTTQAIADLGGGGSVAPVYKNDGIYGGFAGRYYTLRSEADTSASSFHTSSADNLGTLFAVTSQYAGQTIYKPSTITNIKLNYSTQFAETYICYLVVKRVAGTVETNSILWTSPDLVNGALSEGSLDTTGLSISLLENDRLFTVTLRTATTEGAATGIALSIALYE